MDSILLNADYELMYHKPDGDVLFFTNKNNETLIQLSKIEFEIIEFYAKTNDVEQVQDFFSKDFDIENEFIFNLIDRALATNLLITNDGKNEKLKKKKFELSRIESIAEYLVYKLTPLFLHLGLNFNLDFKGNLNFYKLVSVDFSKSKFPAFIYNSHQYILNTYFISLISSVIFFIYVWSQKPTIKAILDISPPSGILVFLVIISGILFTTLLHELGHYILYYKYGGKTSKIGLALLIGILPVMYVSTNSLYLWSNKNQRIAVASAGIAVDILLFFISANILIISFPSSFSFYIIFFLYLFLVRILANLNPFIPGTDGYFILTDLIASPALYQNTAFQTRNFAQNMSSFNFKAVNKIQVLSMAYLTLSVFSITLYYLSIGMFILFPLAVRFIF